MTVNDSTTLTVRGFNYSNFEFQSWIQLIKSDCPINLDINLDQTLPYFKSLK